MTQHPPSTTSSTPESPPGNSAGTLKDRLLRCNRITQGTESFRTSGLASISKEEACSTYWTSRSRDDSATLWLPTATGSLDLDSTWSSISSRVTEPWLQCCTLQKSRLATEEPQSSQTTCLRSLRFSQPDITEDGAVDPGEEEEAEEEATKRCRKIRIFPTAKQTAMFNQMAGASRYLYNRANAKVIELMKETKERRVSELEALKASDPTPRCCHQSYPKRKNKDDPLPPPVRCTNSRCVETDGEWFCTSHRDSGSLGISYAHFLSLSKLRPLVMKSDADIADDSPEAWLKEVPYDTRQGAVKELLGAYKSAFALKRGGHIKHFKMHFKKKKDIRQSFHCRSNAFSSKDRIIFRTRLGKKGGKLRFRKRDISKILPRSDETGQHSDFVVQMVRPGAWYLCLPMKLKADRIPVFENAAYKSAFIDPGVRTFGTFYSPDGVCGKIGDGFCTKYLDALTARLDMLASMQRSRKHRVTGVHLQSRTVRNLRDRCQQLRNKLKHKVDDLHWKTCAFLTTAFQKIFIPQFGVKDMVQRTSPRGRRRVIGNTTARRMLQLAHGRFLERLQYVAKTKQREVYIVPEAYTTCTCGVCGIQNPNVGGNHTFVCNSCGYKMDRDTHGARNICLSTMARMRG